MRYLERKGAGVLSIVRNEMYRSSFNRWKMKSAGEFIIVDNGTCKSSYNSRKGNVHELSKILEKKRAGDDVIL